MSDEINQVFHSKSNLVAKKANIEPETPQIISDMIKQLPQNDKSQEDIDKLVGKEIEKVDDKKLVENKKTEEDFKNKVEAIKDNIEITEMKDAVKDKALGVRKDGKVKEKAQGIEMLLAAANQNEKNDKGGKFKQPIQKC